MLPLLRVINIRSFSSKSASSLYIVGEKAKETFAILKPHIDFDEKLKNLGDLQNSINLRGLSVNLSETIDLWNYYKEVNEQKLLLEETRAQISTKLKQLTKSSDQNAEEINMLKEHGRLIREDLKTFKENFTPLEESAALKVLCLPNILNPHTSHSKNVVHSYKMEPQIKPQINHLDVGKNLDLIEYHDQSYFFLKGNAALFDFKAPHIFSNLLLNEGFSMFSNADFARSIVIEGCGKNYTDASQTIILEEPPEHCHENSRLHLCGGATLESFMAYFTKHSVPRSIFPMKYFCISKKYEMCSPEISLRNTMQATCLTVFIATENSANAMDVEYDALLKLIISVYERFDVHFRVVILPAKELGHWESLRASIEMFLHSINDYVEVGHISLSNNFISKRLQFSYIDGENQVQYPHVLSGTLLNIPKLLACLLENHDQGSLENVFKDFLK